MGGEARRGGAGSEPRMRGEREMECLPSAAGEAVVRRGLLTSGTHRPGGQPTCQKHTLHLPSLHLLLEVWW